MRIEDHIIATEAILEFRGVRAWNRSAAQLVAGTVDDPDQQPETVLGNGANPILGAAHAGLVIFHTDESTLQFWDGSAYRRSSRPKKTASSWDDFAVTTGNFLIGQSSLMTEVAKSSIPISGFGAAAADVSFGSYKLTNLASPVDANDGANKAYVDSVAGGIRQKDDCAIATDDALPACVYNGAAGTLTASVNSALANTDIDAGGSGVTLAAGAEGVGTRVLVNNQSSEYQNGIYIISNLGSASTKWVLTRADDSNTNDELLAAYTYVRGGTWSGTAFRQKYATSEYDIDPGSGMIKFSIYFQQQVYSGGNGIDITSTTISAKIDAAPTWAANKVLITGTNTLITASTSKSFAPFWYNGTSPAFASWALPNPSSGDTGKLYYYDHASLAFTAATSHGINKVLITDTTGNGLPKWSTDIPAGTTIGTKTPLFNDTPVPINLGGTYKNHDGSAVGSMLYKLGAQFTNTATAPTSTGFIPMVTSYTDASNLTIDMVNLFSRTNTWTAVNIYESTTLAMRVTGDAQNRLQFSASGPAGGRILFGPGGATAPDTYLERRGTRQLQFVGTDASNTVSFYLSTNHTFTGSGKWQAGVIERLYGGFGVSTAAWDTGSLGYANASGSFSSTGAGISGSILRSQATSAAWTSYAIPATVAAGDLLYASGTTSIVSLVKPANDNYILGLSSGLPTWKSLIPTRGLGPSGTGSVVGYQRVWVTLYNGLGAIRRDISFSHPLGTRNVTVSARKTNADDTLNPSEQFATRFDVIDSSTVRVWFSSTPTSGDNYVITVSG